MLVTPKWVSPLTLLLQYALPCCPPVLYTLGQVQREMSQGSFVPATAILVYIIHIYNIYNTIYVTGLYKYVYFLLFMFSNILPQYQVGCYVEQRVGKLRQAEAEGEVRQ